MESKAFCIGELALVGRVNLKALVRGIPVVAGVLLSSHWHSTNAAEACGVRFSERLIVSGSGPVSTVHGADLDGDGDSDEVDPNRRTTRQQK